MMGEISDLQDELAELESAALEIMALKIPIHSKRVMIRRMLLLPRYETARRRLIEVLREYRKRIGTKPLPGAYPEYVIEDILLSPEFEIVTGIAVSLVVFSFPPERWNYPLFKLPGCSVFWPEVSDCVPGLVL